MQHKVTKGPRNERDRLLLPIVGAIAVIMTALCIWLLASKDATGPRLDQLEARLQEEQRANATLQRIMEIDEAALADRDPQAALQRYRELLDTVSEKHAQKIKLRMDRLTARAERKIDTSFVNLPHDSLLQHYEARIEDLERSVQEQVTWFDRVRDSLMAERDDLQLELIRTSKELASRETVQMLSFNGLKGHKIHYLGEVKDGKAHGGGVGIWSTGSIYRGNWVNGVRHGKGVFEWEDGQRYEGEYVHGIREGKGTYYWPGGDRYEGQWREDKRNGYGILYDMDGNIRYEGEWVDDKPVGGKS